MLIAEKRNWKKENAELSALLPDRMKADGWKIGREGNYHTLWRPFGKVYQLHGSWPEARMGCLKKWIWLHS